MARVDRSRIEVFPVAGGFRLQRFDAYGRKLAPYPKVFTRRNNCRREALKVRDGLALGQIPILSVEKVSRTTW